MGRQTIRFAAPFGDRIPEFHAEREIEVSVGSVSAENGVVTEAGWTQAVRAT